VDDRPTYGYRRVTALVNRVLAAQGKPAANHRRVFRIMKQRRLLLQRHLHDGKVVVMRSNLRWCSDVFETTCWNGEMVRIVFAIDAHDREVLAWHGALLHCGTQPGVQTASPRPLSERSSAIMLAYIHCRMPLIVLRQIAGWFDDYNESHPHSGLGMISPKEFRAQVRWPGVRSNGGNTTILVRVPTP